MLEFSALFVRSVLQWERLLALLGSTLQYLQLNETNHLELGSQTNLKISQAPEQYDVNHQHLLNLLQHDRSGLDNKPASTKTKTLITY